MPSKLSRIQRNVLEKMAGGWMLTRSLSAWQGTPPTLHRRNGSDSITVGTNTWFALFRRGYIECVESDWPTERYGLTDEGRDALRSSSPTGK